jgi:predicted HTH transcriptional regulator
MQLVLFFEIKFCKKLIDESDCLYEKSKNVTETKSKNVTETKSNNVTETKSNNVTETDINNNLKRKKSIKKIFYESQIIELIESNNKITQNEIANLINISRRTVIRIFKESNKIKRVGGDSSGFWEIINN